MRNNIPDYIKINQITELQRLSEIEDVNERELRILAYLTNTDYEVLLDLDYKRQQKLVNKINNIRLNSIVDEDVQFMFIFKGVAYGFTPPSEMTNREWIDIEHVVAHEKDNIAKLMAIIYRPIITSKWRMRLWNFKNILARTFLKKSLMPTGAYKIEKYTHDTLEERTELFGELPEQMASSTIGFFLACAKVYLINSQAYLEAPKSEQTKMEVESLVRILFPHITDGS